MSLNLQAEAARCMGLRCGAYACIVIEGDPFCEDCAPDPLLAMDCEDRAAFVAAIDAKFQVLPIRRLAEPCIECELQGERITLELVEWLGIKQQIVRNSSSRAA